MARTPTKELPPYLKFLNQTKGTLPEILGETHLKTLNLALGVLFTHLREARRQFEQEGDDGRSAAFTALGAYWMFIVLFDGPLAESLQIPILRLQEALPALDKNLVLPIVKPIRRRGRAPSSDARATLKGHAAGTVEWLLRTGMERQDSHREVAKLLKKIGVRPERGSGSVTLTTVRHWCDEVASDVGRRSSAAIMYDSMFVSAEHERFSTLAQDQARRFALDTLAAWVRTVFPELGKPT
jgi:hypothetical protein